MEYDFNDNLSGNEQSLESEGDSITIDNNDYEDYSEELLSEENQNQGFQGKSKKKQKAKKQKSISKKIKKKFKTVIGKFN